jgi:hypothetical protein
MTKNELFSLNRRLATVLGHAETVEAEVCEALNDLSAELIPTSPELTEEAARQLKEHSFHTLSSAIDALMDVIAEMEDPK